MTWVKRGPLLRAAAGGLVLWLIVFFFFDPLFKWALVTAGEAAAGAKVDVGSLKTRWLKGSLIIGRVAVADRNRPMKNVVELSDAVFVADVGAALRGKFVVREAAIEGMRFGTARRASGALRRVKPPKLETEIVEKLSPGQQSVAGVAVKAEHSAVGQVDAAKLSGLKKLDDAKAKGREIDARWKTKQSDAQQIEKESRQIAEDLKALGGGDPLKKVSDGLRAQKKIRDLIARVDAQRVQARQDLDEVQGALKEADELRHKDVDGLLAVAGLPTLDSSDLARRLLGAQTASRLATTLHWMRWARERAAASKAAAGSGQAGAAAPAPPRRQGVDVEFPRAHVYPQFLLEQAKLSGTLDKVLMGQDMALSGVLAGVTSNPALYGRPATLTLGGQASGGLSLKFEGRLEQQKDPVGVGVKFAGSGFSLAGASLGDSQLGGVVSEGSARATGEIRADGEEWKGEVFVEASGVKIEPKVALAGPAGTLAADALRSLNGFKVRVGISGKEGDLKLAFSSNAGDVLAAAMRKALAGQYEAQRAALQTKVDALYDAKLKDVRAQTDGLQGRILGPLDAQKAGLERQLQDSLRRSVGGGKGLPNLNRLFK